MTERRRADRLPKEIFVSFVGDHDPTFSFTRDGAERNLHIQVGFAALMNPSIVGGRIVRYVLDPETREV